MCSVLGYECVRYVNNVYAYVVLCIYDVFVHVIYTYGIWYVLCVVYMYICMGCVFVIVCVWYIYDILCITEYMGMASL
jgi:hypothetical protein